MDIKSPTDHIAMLALMMTGVLVERLDDLGQLDDSTTRHLHQLVRAVRKHADIYGHQELNTLFDRIDSRIGSSAKGGAG